MSRISAMLMVGLAISDEDRTGGAWPSYQARNPGVMKARGSENDWKAIATFRRKIGALGRVVKGAQQRKTRRERPAGGFTEPDGEGGRIYRVARFSIARPMLMRLSAMTPRPTQRFIPASPL